MPVSLQSINEKDFEVQRLSITIMNYKKLKTLESDKDGRGGGGGRREIVLLSEMEPPHSLSDQIHYRAKRYISLIIYSPE